MRYFLRKWIVASFLMISPALLAKEILIPLPYYQQPTHAEEISQLLFSVTAKPTTQRIELFSASLKGKRYLRGACGEGYDGRIDQSPLYRLDAFDCQTFVSTVVALATSTQLVDFIATVKKIQYRHAKVDYFSRSHFIDIDWHQRTRDIFLQDITNDISTQWHYATAVIDKKSWYKHHSSNEIKLFTPNLTHVRALLMLFNKQANKESIKRVKTKYLPLTTLFLCDKNVLTPVDAIFKRIPSGAIIEIIDKNQMTSAKIGTDLNVIHLGFAIRLGNELLFRHASKNHGQVIDVRLIDYLKRYYELALDPSKAGIHIERVQ